MKRLFIFLLVLGMVLLVSCTVDEIEPTSTSSSSANLIVDNSLSENNGYPVEGATVIEGYPSSVNDNHTTDLVMEMVIPSLPEDGFSTLTGQLMLLDIDGDSKPIHGIILYLGEIITLSNGSPGMAAVDKQTAPSTISSGVGQFLFEDVEPGEYVLIVDQIAQTFILNNPGGGDMIIDVQPNQITDIGELRYSEFPIDIGELP